MSLIARHLEAAGLPTVCLASARDIVDAGRPPRAVFVDYPLGHTSGKPFDAADQRDVVSRALAAFESLRTPGTVLEAPNRWRADDAWRADAMRPAGDDTRQARDTTPRYQFEADRLAAEAGDLP